MTEKHTFGVTPVTCHAFNGNRTVLALSQDDEQVKIYHKDKNGWQDPVILSEHGQRVTGIDWAPKSNRIVTCGADRNAYVWNLKNVDGKEIWKPVLVILRINRAATCVKWSPNESKFAVGCGSRLISISYYEEDNDWWVSKHIKKPIRSTVTCVDWHPNNVLVAAGSSDFKARIFSGYIKEVDEKPKPCSWGEKMTFSHLMSEFSNGKADSFPSGWVHSVSFSPSGNLLAWVGHDSSVCVAKAGGENCVAVVRGDYLPFMGITWVSENLMVAVGYDCNPMLFTYTDKGTITFNSKLDIPQQKESSQMSAMSRFRNMDRQNTTDDSTSILKTQHQNTITQVSIHTGTKENCAKIATSGVDGNVIIWDLKKLNIAMSGLKI